MKRVIPWLLIVSLLLSGCSGVLDGSYVSVTPHQKQETDSDSDTVSVSSYTALRRALESMIQNGQENSVISVAHYDQLVVARDTRMAIQRIMSDNPLGVYAVEKIEFELGTNAGEPALAVQITYLHGRTELAKIQNVSEPEELEEAIAEALDNCDSGIILYVEDYRNPDLIQWVADYGLLNPDKVIEQPQVTVNIYPEEGTGDRILELKFTYQNSREDLRDMQAQVENIFDQAESRAEKEDTWEEKYEQIFLYMQELLGEYQQNTSITAAYSLLLHGVGDSKAVATVFSAMCRRAGLECMTVTGTRNGEPWNWNIICCDGVYYYTDFLRGVQGNGFRMLTDEDMSGYVWDYSAYPDIGIQEPPEEEPIPEGETETTEKADTEA